LGLDLAPELCAKIEPKVDADGNPIDQSVYFRYRPNDIWSVGVILYAMVYAKFPLNDPDPKKRVHNVHHEEPDYPSESFAGWLVTNDLKSIMRLMLMKDPLKRPSARELLKSTWIRGGKRPYGCSDGNDFTDNGDKNGADQTVFHKCSFTFNINLPEHHQLHQSALIPVFSS